MATPISSANISYISNLHFNRSPSSSLLTKVKANEQSLVELSIEEIKKFLSTINLDSSDPTFLTCLNSIDFSKWTREDISDLLTPIQAHLPIPLESLNTVNFMRWDSSELVTFALNFLKHFPTGFLLFDFFNNEDIERFLTSISREQVRYLNIETIRTNLSGINANVIHLLDGDSKPNHYHQLNIKDFSKKQLMKLKAKLFTSEQIAQINENVIDQAFLLSFFNDEKERMIELTDTQICRIDYVEVDPRYIPFFQKILRKMKNPPIPQELPKASQSSSSSSTTSIGSTPGRSTTPTPTSTSTPSTSSAGVSSTSSTPKPAVVAAVQAINFDYYIDEVQVNLILQKMPEERMRFLSLEMMRRNIKKVNTTMKDKWINSIKGHSNIVHQLNVVLFPKDVILRLSAKDFSVSQIKQIDFSSFTSEEFIRFFSNPPQINGDGLRELNMLQTKKCAFLIPLEWFDELTAAQLREMYTAHMHSQVKEKDRWDKINSILAIRETRSTPREESKNSREEFKGDDRNRTRYSSSSSSSSSTSYTSRGETAGTARTVPSRSSELDISKVLKMENFRELPIDTYRGEEQEAILRGIARLNRLKELSVERMCKILRGIKPELATQWLNAIRGDISLTHQLNFSELPWGALNSFHAYDFSDQQMMFLNSMLLSDDSFIEFFSKTDKGRSVIDINSLRKLDGIQLTLFAFKIPVKCLKDLSAVQLMKLRDNHLFELKTMSDDRKRTVYEERRREIDRVLVPDDERLPHRLEEIPVKMQMIPGSGNVILGIGYFAFTLPLEWFKKLTTEQLKEIYSFHKEAHSTPTNDDRKEEIKRILEARFKEENKDNTTRGEGTQRERKTAGESSNRSSGPSHRNVRGSTPNSSNPRYLYGVNWALLCEKIDYKKGITDLRKKLEKDPSKGNYSKGTEYYNKLRKNISDENFDPSWFFSLYSKYSGGRLDKKAFGLINKEIHADKNLDDTEIASMINSLFNTVWFFVESNKK